MSNFYVQFTREVTITESVTRVIEADSPAAAAAIAEKLASGFNMDCPDDASESATGNFEAGDWSPGEPSATTARADINANGEEI